MSELSSEPLDARQLGARELGLRFATRRRRIGFLLTVAGLALAFGGLAGFGHYGDRASSLQKNGVHTTATVTAAALYGGSLARNGFTEHIDVEFATPSGTVSGTRIPIGESDRFVVGQQVEISYDPSNPHHAVFAHGYTDVGPIGFVLFFAIVAGICVLIYAGKALRLAHGARRALADGSRTMTVETRLVPQARRNRTALVLAGSGGDALPLWPTGRGFGPLLQPVEATVYGTETPGSVAVVVDLQRGAATAGRIWKRRRL
jgi:hypothetical protein